jgi:uncharacterized membrane protein (Fun14 family)
MHCRPYYCEELNMVQAASLLINVFTLFVGIMLILYSYLEADAIQAGEMYDPSGRTAVSIILFLANLLVILVPLMIAVSNAGVATIDAQLLRNILKHLERFGAWLREALTTCASYIATNAAGLSATLSQQLRWGSRQRPDKEEMSSRTGSGEKWMDNGSA